MLYKVTRITLLIVIPMFMIWALINLERKEPMSTTVPQIYLKERIASPKSKPIHQSTGIEYNSRLEYLLKRTPSPSHRTTSPSEGINQNSWLEERAQVYNHRRERVKAACDKSTGIHNPKEGERFVLDTQDGIAYCMNLKVRTCILII